MYIFITKIINLCRLGYSDTPRVVQNVFGSAPASICITFFHIHLY